MQDKGYAYIIPDAQGTKHIWVIQGPEGGPFSWVDVGAAGVGIQGPKGTDGVGLNTLTDTDLTYGNVTVTYNATDGIGINGTMRQTYDGTNHDSTVDMNIPLIPGAGIVINKQDGSEKVEIKIDPNIVSKTYRHLLSCPNYGNTITYTISVYSSKSDAITTDYVKANPTCLIGAISMALDNAQGTNSFDRIITLVDPNGPPGYFAIQANGIVPSAEMIKIDSDTFAAI